MDLYESDIKPDSPPDVTCKTNFIWRGSEGYIEEITEDVLKTRSISPSNFALQPGMSHII